MNKLVIALKLATDGRTMFLVYGFTVNKPL